MLEIYSFLGFLIGSPSMIPEDKGDISQLWVALKFYKKFGYIFENFQDLSENITEISNSEIEHYLRAYINKNIFTIDIIKNFLSLQTDAH